MICFQLSTVDSSIFIPIKPTSSGALCSRKHTPSKLDNGHTAGRRMDVKHASGRRAAGERRAGSHGL